MVKQSPGPTAAVLASTPAQRVLCLTACELHFQAVQASAQGGRQAGHQLRHPLLRRLRGIPGVACSRLGAAAAKLMMIHWPRGNRQANKPTGGSVRSNSAACHRAAAAKSQQRNRSAGKSAAKAAQLRLTREPDVQAAQQRAPPLHPAPVGQKHDPQGGSC